ncbi:MAG: GHMP kinase [Chloroflexota bacterium]|nr:GHMP kinase [Dehalococcoidia bacterium]MDW8252675.1 GHMP kinase [Chloroflexota bacterium]
MTVWTPATAGELVQGMIDGIHVHVSAPIDWYVAAEMDLDGRPLRGPTGRPKALAALRTFLERRGLPARGMLRLCSTVPPGKGLGSSTADIGAALFAAARAFGVALSAEEATRLALTVEPTDGSLFPGIVVFDHRDGRWLEPLGDPPPVAVVLLDPGGTVDTVAYNAVDRSAALARHEPQTREAVAMVRAALRAGDVALLGAAATLSATTHQALLPKPLLAPALSAGREAGAVGVCVAHSGTAIGILFDARRADAEAACRWIARRLGCPARLVRLVSGGPRFSRAEVASGALLPVS